MIPQKAKHDDGWGDLAQLEIDAADSKAKREDWYNAQQMLMDAFDFDQDDLEANRAGELTPRQRARQHRQSARSQQNMELRTLLLVLLIVLVAVLPLPAGMAVAGTSYGIICALGSALLLAGLRLNQTFRLREARRHLAADRALDEVSTVIGNVLLDTQLVDDYKIDYTLRVGDFLFKLKKEECFAFKQGDMYAIYFAPRDKAILSAEPLDE